MNVLMGLAEHACGVLVSILTIPLMLLGFLTGMRGIVRYVRIKFM